MSRRLDLLTDNIYTIQYTFESLFATPKEAEAGARLIGGVSDLMPGPVTAMMGRRRSGVTLALAAMAGGAGVASVLEVRTVVSD